LSRAMRWKRTSRAGSSRTCPRTAAQPCRRMASR
jgi:hypothetical protein